MRPLIIHPDPNVLKRFSDESDGVAKVTASMVEALKWISNQDENISGVFLCPEETHFSAFRFLEIILNHRPALPVYLFEPGIQGQTEMSRKISSHLHVKGFFVGTESYETLISQLSPSIQHTVREPRPTPKKSDEINDFTAIPVSDFYHGETYPFDLFTLDSTGSIMFFAAQNAPVQNAYLESLSRKSPFLYVKTQDVVQARQRIEDLKSNALDSPLISPEWKNSEMISRFRRVLHEMRASSFSEQVLSSTHQMLHDLFRLISAIETFEKPVYDLIRKARKSDRSIFCASYALLMCRKMRFEKISTLEILGIASILQDISLYHTPHGDLSSKSREAMSESELKYYLKHPHLSADLIQQGTDVPQITLQVIRQQHEKKDRSGFPEKIGGSALHPMAEILSLINEFYDISIRIDQRDQQLKALEQTAFPHYSDAVVNTFKLIHARL